MANVDPATVEGFGAEWKKFDFSSAGHRDADELFEDYFSLFPWDQLPPDAVGFDVGCGSGRWAVRVAPRVGLLHCVDASAEALAVAESNLSGFDNCRFHHATADEMPLPDRSMDFGYSLGVLHHVPDTAAALAACTQKLKPGAPFLVYLYYALENRPLAYRALYRLSDVVRRRVSGMPWSRRYAVSQLIAAGVYLPLARSAALLERVGLNVENLPLAGYRRRSFYVMQNDALDRFGTRLEQRFRREEIEAMMRQAGLEKIRFREAPPYWCAIGHRRPA